jgi:hypothetical protein
MELSDQLGTNFVYLTAVVTEGRGRRGMGLSCKVNGKAIPVTGRGGP